MLLRPGRELLPAVSFGFFAVVILVSALVYGSHAGWSPGLIKMMNVWSTAACTQLQRRQRDRQVEAPRSGASRIDVENPVDGLDPRSMRVAGYDHINAAGPWIELQFLQIV
jgi:hypothetical protein